MYCLVCHAKISRWRRMKTSSEFCCEEHAEQYKKETVGRLLEYAEPPHASGPIDPIHRLAILAGEKAPAEEEASWQIQEFLSPKLRHQTSPRIRVAAASPAAPRLHRPGSGGLQPRKIWNPSLIHLLPREGPWSTWLPAEPLLPTPTGHSLSELAFPRQPAATRAEARSGLRRRSAQGLPDTPPALCAGIDPSGAAPPGRRSAPAPVALGLPRTRTSAGQVCYPGPTASAPGFSRISPGFGFIPASAGLAAAPAAAGGFITGGVEPAAWRPVPVWLQALPFAPLRRTTPSFLSLAATPGVGPNGSSHRTPVVSLWTGVAPALRLPEVPPARKFGRLAHAESVASTVSETRLLDAVALLPAARHVAPGAVPSSPPAILRAPTPLERPLAILEAFQSTHTVAPASLLLPALAASALAGRRLDLAPALERPVPAAVSPRASNTWSPTAGISLLRPTGSPFSSAPAESAPQPLRPQGPSPWLTATRLLTGPSCSYSPREPASGSTSVNQAVPGEAFRLTATAADMIVSRVSSPAVPHGPLAAPRAAAAHLEPRRVALSLPPSSHLALVMPASAAAAGTAPAASSTIIALSRAVSTRTPETRAFAEVRYTVAPAALTAVPAASATPLLAPDSPAAPLPAPHPPPTSQRPRPGPLRPPVVPSLAAATPVTPASTPLAPLQAQPHPAIPATGLAAPTLPRLASLEPTVPNVASGPAPLAAALPVEIGLPLLSLATGHPPLATAPAPLPTAPDPLATAHRPLATESPLATGHLPLATESPLATGHLPLATEFEPLPALAIELRRRELPPPLPARRTARIADRVGAEAAFGPGRRAPAPAPTTAPALLSPNERSIALPVSSSLQFLQITFAAPRVLDPLPATEPVPRLDINLAPKPILRPARAPVTDGASVREALDTVQKSTPNRLAIVRRAAWVLWHDAVVPFLATRRGKLATATVLTVLSLFLGLRAPNGPLRGVARAAILPMAERSYFLSEEGFASGFDAWTNPAPLNKQDNGLVEVRDGLTLYKPSLRRVDYDFSFAGTIRRAALGWVVRATDDSNYYVCKLAWRGKGKEKRSVLIRYPVVNGAPAAPEKVVALPFELEENKVYNLDLTVHGDRITTQIDGRGVDSFSDNRLRTGGIGFLAGPGEQSLVHSIAVSGNDDTTGRFWAWIFGFGRFIGGKAFGS